MDIQEIAKHLQGNHYGQEVPAHIQKAAKDAGIVIVFGYSDDNCEFVGAIEAEIPCWKGGEIYFNKDESKFTDEANMIEAVWCDTEKVYHDSGDYFSWTYKTDIPHATFDIFEDETPFCRGIVFSVNDLK